MKTLRIAAVAALSASVLAFSAASAAPIVTGSVTGSSGAWTHTFTIQNTLGGTNRIYFFGVRMPNGTELSAPSGWDPNQWPTWGDNVSYGGSATVYNNVWINGSIAPSSSGIFQVLDSSTTAMTGIQWFAYAQSGTYNGGDNFNTTTNPGFEGRIGTAVAPVPEPGVWALMILGMGAVGGAMRRRQKQALNVRFA
jgi:hypothetical protein